MQPDLIGCHRLKIDVYEDLPCFRELHSVAQQIDQNLLQATRIAPQMIRDLGRDAAGNLQSLFSRSQDQHLRCSGHAFGNAKVHALEFQLTCFDF